jgi:hypothetical protein
MLNEANKEMQEGEINESQIVDEMREIVSNPIDPVEQEEPVADVPKYTDTELAAMAKGWKPQDKFDKSGKKYLTAEEFIDRGELYESLSHQKKENKKLQESIKEILELNKRQAELSLKDRVNYFQQQRNAAIDLGSKVDFEKYDTEYEASKKELERVSGKQTTTDDQEKLPTPQQHHPAVAEFVQRNNSWFYKEGEENVRMTKFVQSKEVYLRNNHPEWSDEKCILEAERSVKDLFPHRFENVNRSRKPSVNVPSGDGISVPTSKKTTFNQLPRDVQLAIKPWAERCDMSLDDYADQLIKEGVIKNVR